MTEQNKSVTIIVKDLNQLKKEKTSNLFYYFYRLYKAMVQIYFYSRISKINEDNLDLFINRKLDKESADTMLKIFSNANIPQENQMINIDCDLLVYEPELIPNNKLYLDLVNKKYKGELYLVGNALEISSLDEIIKSAYFVGKNL